MHKGCSERVIVRTEVLRRKLQLAGNVAFEGESLRTDFPEGQRKTHILLRVMLFFFLSDLSCTERSEANGAAGRVVELEPELQQQLCPRCSSLDFFR